MMNNAISDAKQLLTTEERARLKQYADKCFPSQNAFALILSDAERRDFANIIDKALAGIELGELGIHNIKPA